MVDFPGYTFHSVSWVRIWAHTNTMLSGQPGHRVNLVGKQRAKIKQASKTTAHAKPWRDTWLATIRVLQQVEDGNLMERING